MALIALPLRSICVVSLLACCQLALNLVTPVSGQETQRVKYAIAIHGGAGTVPDAPDWRQGRETVLAEALERGTQLLASGADGLDAVEQVIQILEDSPLFNAGRGAVFNAAGGHELDASIMDGRTLACGAVGGVRTVRHPISLARLVMTETPHILLVTDGAEAFADDVGARFGIERVDNSYFSTDAQRAKLIAAQAKEAAQARPADDDSRGTVGCVVLDGQGNLSAGTSTGGLTNKRFGRLGDSPLIASGTYADNRSCAVSCTGVGEDFIRHAVAFDVSARMRYRGESLDEAVQAVLNSAGHQVRGGLIAVDRQGNIAMKFNTPGMSRAAANADGLREIHAAE